MSYFIDICLLCLNNSVDLKLMGSNNENDIGNKLKYCLPENELTSDISLYICVKCVSNLNNFYEFKRECLQNMTTYKKLAQQITNKNESYKFSSVGLAHNFPNDDNYDTTEQKCSKVFVKCAHQVTEESISYTANSQYDTNNYDTFQTGKISNYEELIIKEESDELKMDNETVLLLNKIKQEKSELDVPFSAGVEQNCNEKFSNNEDLEQHVKIHNTDELFTCEECKKCFQSLSNLNKHKLIHTGEKIFTCEVCNKSFRRPDTLKKHKLTHTNEKPFSCEVCNKSFRQVKTLKQHKLVHTDEKPFACEICNQSFRQSATLKSHKLEHTGEKPFTCEVCNKSFRQLKTLKHHKFVHTGEKPFTCEVCNKSFRQLGTLKTHKLVHTHGKPFTCEVCNKFYRNAKTLKKHKLLHNRKNHLEAA